MQSAVHGKRLSLSPVAFTFNKTLQQTAISTASALAFLLVMIIAAMQPAHAGTETVLHSFAGKPDGSTPFYSGVVLDGEGNIYGTTYEGGAYGYGSIYEVTAGGTESVLYSFNPGTTGGGAPAGGLIFDKNGNLYGTTTEGGEYNAGVVFEFAPSTGVETVLHSFNPFSSPDGGYPYGNLVFDKKGNLYGTTTLGGTNELGTVFEITHAGVESVLYSFTGGSDGSGPFAGVMLDAEDNLYGTTSRANGAQTGAVWKLSPPGVLNVLHTFTGSPDAADPDGPLVFDKAGNLYGLTVEGGASKNCSGGCGTIYEITAAGTEEVLVSFNSTTNGAGPIGGLLLAPNGDLVGATDYAGPNGGGTLFALTTGHTLLNLYSFTGGADGGGPMSYLGIYKGSVYGATFGGGADKVGTVFKYTP